MRRKITVVAAATGLALALTACGGGDSSDKTADTGDASATPSSSGAAGASTLVVWADNSAQTAKAIEPLCQKWAAQNGVTCTVKKFNGGGPLSEQLTKGNASGDVPDIFEGPHDQIGGNVDNGILAPIDLSAVASSFNPKAIQGVTYNGNTYGVPWAVENVALLTNKKLSPSCPATMDEAVATAKDLISAGTIQKGLGIALQIGETGDAYSWYPLYSADGGYSYGENSDGTYNPDDLGVTAPESIKAGERLRTMARDGMFKPSVSYDIAKEAFQTGKSPFWITGPWATPDAKTALGADLLVCSVPNWKGSEPTSKPFLGIRTFFQPAKAKNPTLASTFLTYVESTEFMDGMYAVDPRPSAWTESYEKQASDPIIKGFGDYGADGTAMPNIPEMANWFSDMGLAEVKIASGQDPKKVLQASDASIEKANATLG